MGSTFFLHRFRDNILHLFKGKSQFEAFLLSLEADALNTFLIGLWDGFKALERIDSNLFMDLYADANEAQKNVLFYVFFDSPNPDIFDYSPGFYFASIYAVLEERHEEAFLSIMTPPFLYSYLENIYSFDSSYSCLSSSPRKQDVLYNLCKVKLVDMIHNDMDFYFFKSLSYQHQKDFYPIIKEKLTSFVISKPYDTASITICNILPKDLREDFLKNIEFLVPDFISQHKWNFLQNSSDSLHPSENEKEKIEVMKEPFTSGFRFF